MADVRWDETGEFVWGNLTWTGTGGRIVWGPNPNMVDDKPDAAPEDPVYEERALVGGPVSPAPPEADVFVSDPLPNDVVLNVSRSIQFALALKQHPKNANTCDRIWVEPLGFVQSFEPDFHIRVLAGTTILGGTLRPSEIKWGQVLPERHRPADDNGYMTCYYGMHPEIAFLPKGTVLTLRIEPVRQAYDYPYGLQGAHQSTLRLPLLPADEIPFRYPDFLPAQPGDEEFEDLPTGGPVSAFVGFAGLLLVPRRRVGVGAAAGLLLAAGLAGCLSSGDPAPAGADASALEGQADHSFVKDDRGVLTEGGRGTVLGRVFDDVHIPIPGVHVSVLGRQEFAQTDGKGRFKFPNLSPGILTIRFDRLEYRSFETEVEVKAGFVSRADVMLYLTDPASRNLVPHPHDYWNGQTSKEIFRRTITETCTGPSGTDCAFQEGPHRPILIDGREDDIRSVLPGTREVEITLSFDPTTAHPERYGLVVRGNLLNRSYFAARPTGQPFHVQATWEMADPGHQPFSTWEIGLIPLIPDVDFAGDLVASADPSYHYSPLTLTVVVRRGPVLPLEPPHEDRWHGKDKVHTVVAVPGTYYSTTVPEEVPTSAVNGCAQVASQVWIYTCYRRDVMEAQPVPTRFVPSGTRFIDFELTQTREADPAFDWILLYKPASLPRHQANALTGEGYRPVAPTSHADLTTKWRIPVKESEVDPEYATVTGWDFLVVTDDEFNKWLDWMSHGEFVRSASPLPQMQVTMNAWAVRA